MDGFMITTRRTALFLALSFTLAGAGPAFAGKASDQARKDAAAHAAKGNDSAARAAEKRANDRAAQERRNEANAARKGKGK
jgi:hypothetical protein